ncbi:MAG: SCO family protein [Verrucomicrobiae bacterium]|nr:SCO family protein [Verrucomicrobiae bacterium]
MNRTQRLIWTLFGMVMAGLVAVAVWRQGRTPTLPVFGELGSFRLTNQLGAAVSPDSLRGAVTVVNVIFSRCPGQCHRLSQQMSRLQGATPEEVRLVSLTADPEFDSPAVLAQYGARHGARPERWWFLTGTKAEVYRVAEQDLRFTVLDTGVENPSLEDRFIHSGNFVLLDRQGRLRAVVQSEDGDAVEQLQRLVEQLRKESAS